MRFFTLCPLWVAVGVDIQGHPIDRLPTKALPDVYGPVTRDMFNRARFRRAKAAESLRAKPGTRGRAADDCSMCINILLHQDTTQDWSTEFRSEIASQFQHIFQDIKDNHPRSTFSLVTFQDKPVPRLGETTDYCVSYDAQMLDSPSEMLSIYASTPEGVGYDWPENQFGSLFELVNSPTLMPWSAHSSCANLVITITDAGPHFEGDDWQVDYPQLANYTADYEESRADEFCREMYYPDPFMIADSLLDKNIRHATIVWRAGEINTLALRSWVWFDTLLGGGSSYTQALFDDDNDWMTPLEQILAAFTVDECILTETTPAPSQSSSASMQYSTSSIASLPTTREESTEVTSVTDEADTPSAIPSGSSEESPTSEDTHSSNESPTSTQTHATGSVQTTNQNETPEDLQTTSTIELSEGVTTSIPASVSTPISTHTTAPIPAPDTSTGLCQCPSEDPCCNVQPELYLMILKKPSEFDLHMKG